MMFWANLQVKSLMGYEKLKKTTYIQLKLMNLREDNGESLLQDQ